MDLEKRFEVEKNGHLCLYEVDLIDLCEKYGTPLFVFDENCLRRNFQTFRQAFSKHYPEVIVCYSIKTNYNLSLCSIICEEGAFAEVSSGLDLYVARRSGFKAERIVFDGLYKPEATLREALKDESLLVNVESFSELELLNRICGEIGRKQSVGIRVNFHERSGSLFNPDSLYGNPALRFGFTPESAYLAFKRAKQLENLEISGIMTHPFQVGITKLLPFAKKIHKELGIQFRYVNFGGGFRTTEKIGFLDLARDSLKQKLGFKSKLDKKKRNLNLEGIGKAIDALKQHLEDLGRPAIIFEPGYYIVSDAGILLLRVTQAKEAGGTNWVIVDGGTNLVPDYWERREIRVANRATACPDQLANVTGPLLYPHDFIALKRYLPKVKDGDLLAIFNCGAYTLSQSNQFLYPRPSAVMVDIKGEVKEIRKKESYDDAVSMDIC